MNYILPPKLAAVRKTLARSQNRRVMLLIPVWAIFAVPVLLLNPPHSDTMLVIFATGTALIGILGMIYLIRRSKQQSIALGFACPLCGGSLYDGKSNRLGFKGECPCCKKFIFDRLNESTLEHHDAQ